MPRVRVRKTSRGQIGLSRYRDAYEEVKAGDSLRNAADKHGMNHCFLLRYIRKRDASGEDDQVMGYRAHNRIFNEEQEQELSKYFIRCADIYFGLPRKEETSPRPSTSVQAISKNPIVFTPETVGPLPKAPPRKSNKGRKTGKSTIYTDTPEKEAIRKEHETRLKRIKTKQVKKNLEGRKGKKNTSRGKKSNTQQEMSSEEEECYCIICLSPYSESRSGEKWIQCITCKQWAHEECTVVLAMFATIATQMDPYAIF
ncbi:hypothetical protein JTB14_012653 [Gonioctena quinquepunctata]|nr:hypothetical protein JTB14_012653 [Gonioctena quinquepunctata]